MQSIISNEILKNAALKKMTENQMKDWPIANFRNQEVDILAGGILTQGLTNLNFENVGLIMTTKHTFPQEDNSRLRRWNAVVDYYMLTF